MNSKTASLLLILVVFIFYGRHNLGSIFLNHALANERASSRILGAAAALLPTSASPQQPYRLSQLAAAADFGIGATDNAAALLLWANQLTARENYAEALETYQAVLSNTPTPEQTAAAWEAIGRIHRLQSNPAAAISAYRQVLNTQTTQDSSFYQNYGRLLLDQGHWSEAESVLTQGYNLAPENDRLTLFYAISLQRNGELDRATALANQLSTLPQTQLGALRLLGEIAVQRGDTSAALSAYQAALELSPNDAASLRAIRDLNNKR